MLKDFPGRWANGKAEERKRLLNLILCRVWGLDVAYRFDTIIDIASRRLSSLRA